MDSHCYRINFDDGIIRFNVIDMDMQQIKERKKKHGQSENSNNIKANNTKHN